MAAELAPAFQFYPKDFLTDEHVLRMSLQERGAYITLICICWTERTLPDDLTQLARMVGATAPAFRKLWPAVRLCFRACDGGRLMHPRLERERIKQARLRTRGIAGARARWKGLLSTG